MSNLPDRPLLINGFMATGKSSVAAHLAQKWGCELVDLDQLIEAKAQKSIASIFKEQGEGAFRALERTLLLELLAQRVGTRTIISLGGGALLDRGLRIDVLNQAIVVSLSASADTILARARSQDGSTGARPLLAGLDPERAVRRLLSERRDAYLEAHGVVATDARPVAEIAAEVEQIFAQDTVAVAAGEQSYQVHIGPGLIEPRLASLVGRPSGTLLVTDNNVEPLHGRRAQVPLQTVCERRARVVLTPGEEHKNLQGLSQIFQAAFDGGIDRKACLVGLGGGVVTDMTGFAAASWVRGVRWVGLPTTLLSMVDASVGGKTAVDFHTAKNSVGAFWQPSGVICDVETLLTEMRRAYVGALSEVVKTALIGDRDLFAILENEAPRILARDLGLLRQIVDRCIRVKAKIVALDERESGVRAHLNLGHTIGHALESSGGYTAHTHGEAVSLGLVAALRFGEFKGHTDPALTARVLSLLKTLELPHRLERSDLERSTALLGHDKKRAGSQVRFIFARGIGDVIGEATELAEVEKRAPSLADT